MNEKILVPLDGSKVGESALPYVEDLVSKMLPDSKVEITLIQVVSSLTHYVVGGETSAIVAYTEEEINQMKKQAAAYLEKAGQTLKGKGVKTAIQVVAGDAADEIIKAADEMNADIIAMSTHGRSGLSRWAFGSVTDKVLRGGHHPVLVVRAPKDARQD